MVGGGGGGGGGDKLSPKINALVSAVEAMDCSVGMSFLDLYFVLYL